MTTHPATTPLPCRQKDDTLIVFRLNTPPTPEAACSAQRYCCMSIFPKIPSHWYATQPDREVFIPLPPSSVLQKMQSEVDALHAWQGGGLVFGSKPLLGEFKASSFRIRVLSSRRDSATTFLVGNVARSSHGTVVRCSFESPKDYIRCLPITAIAPMGLLMIAGYLASPAIDPSGRFLALILVASTAAGLLVAIAFIAIAMWGIRADARRLARLASSLLTAELLAE